MNKYDYKELREKATAQDAKQSDIDALGRWFELYGEVYWNGEYYDADDDLRLFPAYGNSDDGECEVTGYEFK